MVRDDQHRLVAFSVAAFTQRALVFAPNSPNMVSTIFSSIVTTLDCPSGPVIRS